MVCKSLEVREHTYHCEIQIYISSNMTMDRGVQNVVLNKRSLVQR